MSRNDIIKDAKFEQHRDVHHCYRINLFISCYFHFPIAGRAENTCP